MAQDENALGSFFFYILFVYPVTSYFLKPGRFSRPKGLMLAIGFLVALAAMKTGHEMYERGQNFYQLMGVTRNSNPLEIKRAYKKMSLELHPDKNKSPTAAEDFARLKDAYDTLMDSELREVYNKFGGDGIKANKRFDETQMLLEIAVFYATWGMLAYVLTLGKSSSDARNWIFTGQIIMLIAEVSLMLQETKLPEWFLPTTTEHELVWLMHSLFPAYLNGCRVLGGFLYVDVEEQARQNILLLQEQNKDILLVLRDIQVHIQNIQVGAKSSGAGTNVPPMKATPTAKLRALEERLRLGPAGAPGAKTEVKQEKSGLGFWWMVLLYVAFHLIFNSASSS